MNKNYLVPAAIVIAGIFLAIAVYFMGNKEVAVSTENQTPVTNTDIAVRPVSPTEHILGNPNAPIKIVDYSDTECPFCKQFHQTLKDIYSAYATSGEVAWIYRSFPLHTKSTNEAEALECAADLGGNTAFWKYLDEIFLVTPSNDGLDPAQLPVIAKDVGLDLTAFNTCLSSGRESAKVQADYQDAINAGGQGTPYTVFVTPKGNIANTQGAIPYDAVKNYIDIIKSNI
jgi:protein-disulfide isomerase